VTDFNDKLTQRVTGQEAAEQLMDVAYALAAGAPLELRVGGRRVSVPVADEVELERESGSNGRGVELAFVLSWSSPHPFG